MAANTPVHALDKLFIRKSFVRPSPPDVLGASSQLSLSVNRRTRPSKVHT
jgi:hypothetical protein